jgi:hypothetical protein
MANITDVPLDQRRHVSQHISADLLSRLSREELRLRVQYAYDYTERAEGVQNPEVFRLFEVNRDHVAV